MKTKEINGISTVVCEICEKPFNVGDEHEVRLPPDTCATVATFSHTGHGVPLRSKTELQIFESQIYYHTRCLSSPDYIKEFLNNLTPEQQNIAYKYLHNTWDCRL